MILINSKDIDDFVNDVINCLDEDFVRFSESDKINNTLKKLDHLIN